MGALLETEQQAKSLRKIITIKSIFSCFAFCLRFYFSDWNYYQLLIEQQTHIFGEIF